VIPRRSAEANWSHVRDSLPRLIQRLLHRLRRKHG
jgi:hypothetical protein